MITVKNLNKMVLTPANQSLTLLNDLNFTIPHGQTCAIIGRSGSGKTTLLGLLAGLDEISSGEIWHRETALHTLNEDERALWRKQHVGFVFQNFQLFPHWTVLDNLMIPLTLLNIDQAKEKAIKALTEVGLEQRLQHYPPLLSGGEQQRVAIARAIAHQPDTIFADEPTGNLDQHTGEHIIELLFNLNKTLNTTLILVTHDHSLAARTEQQLCLQDGQLIATSSTHLKEA